MKKPGVSLTRSLSVPNPSDHYLNLKERLRQTEFITDRDEVQTLERFRLENKLTKIEFSSLLEIDSPTYTRILDYRVRLGIHSVSLAVRMGMPIEPFLKGRTKRTYNRKDPAKFK